MPIIHAMLTAAVLAADTTTYRVENHGRQAGEMAVIRNGDSIVVRYAHIDRNRGRWVENRYRVNAAGMIIGGESRPSSRTGVAGEVTESYSLRGDSVSWQRGSSSGTASKTSGVFTLGNSTAFDQARIVRHLLDQPERSSSMIPVGMLRLEIAADTMVPTRRGTQRVRLAMVHSGLGGVPSAVWVDARGELVASSVGWFVTVHPDAEPALPVLRAIEIAYRDRDANARAAGIVALASGIIIIRNADVFDSERGVMRPRTSIVIRNDRIVEIGPTESVQTPAGAHLIDGTGRSVVPGLWDMHTHFQLTSQNAGSIRQLAGGITTIRDMAADTDIGVSHRDRANDGTLVSPRVLLAGFIEGPGLWAGPSAALAATEAEARALVAQYDSLGYEQVKLYNLIHPDLVPAIARETRARGMRLSGHVPRGLSVGAAIRLGYDEINHAAFLFSTFYQDSLYFPEMRPYSGVAARVAPHINVDGAPMTALLADLKAHGTVVDGTFNLWMRDTTGADSTEARKANGNYLRLIKRLHETGITIVAGTDGSSYNLELETYQRAGIPAADVLRIASIVPARVMKMDADYGSIAVGKVADLVMVSGKPAERIADLRNVQVVIRAGRAYEPHALNQALGMQARPAATSRTPDDDLH